MFANCTHLCYTVLIKRREDMIGNKIKTLREENSLTQKELSNRLGININTLASYEREIREPPFSFIAKLAQEFQVSSDWLLGLSE